MKWKRNDTWFSAFIRNNFKGVLCFIFRPLASILCSSPAAAASLLGYPKRELEDVNIYRLKYLPLL